LSLIFSAGSGATSDAERVIRRSDEGVVVGAGGCCAARGVAASRMVPKARLKQHFHPAHFIDVSAPLALDSTVRAQ